MIPTERKPKGPYQLPPADPAQRAFDAVINGDPKKALESITKLEGDEGGSDDSHGNEDENSGKINEE